ncbi:MAG: toll/interleukin-1 receptor domain-containing protein [Betaproteobacteria bacterium]|nr:MAG: toll/interleukin-1 receptor domain-containing protein [Betaproteobacteria bacterium]
MSKVFVSYRRDDAQGEAGHLLADLRRRFGEASVFKDITAIGPGEQFGLAIEKAMAECPVVLVVIGRGWLDARDASGQRRLDDSSDWVRLEVETALAGKRLVIPVLVQGAAMPREKALPESMRPLAHRNAHEMSARRWDYDFEALAKTLENPLGITASETSNGAAASSVRPQDSTNRMSRFLVPGAIVTAAVIAGGVYFATRNGVAPTEPSDATAQHSTAVKMAPAGQPGATGFLSPPRGAFEQTSAFRAFDRLNTELSQRPDLSEADLRHFAAISNLACADQSISCQQATLQKVTKTLQNVCLRKLGMPAVAIESGDELAQLNQDIRFIGCIQQFQSPMLDENLKRGREAVHAIKPG